MALLAALYSLGSAFFVVLTVTLGKVCIIGVESNLNTAFRARVFIAIARVMVAVTGKLHEVRTVPCGEFGFGLASGAATCAFWLCYYYQVLQGGPASVVMHFDRLNLLITVFFSALILREVVGRRYLIGLILLVGGALTLLLLW